MLLTKSIGILKKHMLLSVYG